VEATFRVQGRSPELWDPDSGQVRRQYVYGESAAGTTLPLELAPYGSVFVVFRKSTAPPPPLKLELPGGSEPPTGTRVDAWDGRRATLAVTRPGAYRIATAQGRSSTLSVEAIPAPLELKGPWTVSFPVGAGAPPSARLERLISWTEHPDEGIRHFSGIADYEQDFELPEDWLSPDRAVYLDLGELWAVAEVFLNGRSLGVLWKPPFTREITQMAVAGNNRLRVQVANTWSNRLVGDARLPEEKRITRTNIRGTGGRAWKDVPLLRSGLFGPVRLVPGVRVEGEIR
jgi:hypothetical protein